MKLLFIFLAYFTIQISATAAHPKDAMITIANSKQFLQKDMAYTIVAIRGKIKNISRNEWLRSRSKFGKNDILLFANNKAKMIIIDDLDKSYICSKSGNNKGYSLQPFNKSVTTRPGLIKDFLSLQSFISADPFLILNKRMAISISEKLLQMDNEHFFYIQYTWKGEKINKKLPFEDNVFFIDYKELYQIEGQTIDEKEISDYNFYYYEAKREVSTLIGDFHPVFIDNDELIKEVEVLLENTESASDQDKRDNIKDFIFNFYGKVEEQNQKNWLRLYFDL